MADDILAQERGRQRAGEEYTGYLRLAFKTIRCSCYNEDR